MDKSDVLIQFKIPDTLQLEVEVEAVAVDLRRAERPIQVSGYTTVIRKEGWKKQENDSTLSIEYRVRRNVRKNDDVAKGIVDTELPLAKERFQSGERVLLTIRNVTSGGSYSKVFEVQNYGWDARVVVSPVWIKTFTTSQLNFRTAPSVGYEIYYNSRPDAPFSERFLMPGFGPHLVVVDINETKTVGFGAFLSWIGRTVHIGTGILLNAPGKATDKMYYFLGVNFIEGIEALQ